MSCPRRLVGKLRLELRKVHLHLLARRVLKAVLKALAHRRANLQKDGVCCE